MEKNMGYSYMVIVFAILFVLILIVLHFLKPELDPKWRMISEYEIGKYGWLMRIAFFSWGLSTLSVLLMISRIGNGSYLIYIWLSVLVLALFGAGIFKTNPIMETTKSTVNTIHTICGSIVILTFPILAIVICVRYIGLNAINVPGILIGITVLAWIAQFGFFSSISISQKKDPKAGRVGPTIYLGWPNRIMVLVYALWAITFAMSIKI
jgi:MFS family permease